MRYILFCYLFNKFFLLKNGCTVLHCAAWKGFEQIVKLLIEHGSIVNLQDAVSFFLFVGVVHCLLFYVIDCEWLCDIYFVLLFLTTHFC